MKVKMPGGMSHRVIYSKNSFKRVIQSLIEPFLKLILQNSSAVVLFDKLKQKQTISTILYLKCNNVNLKTALLLVWFSLNYIITYECNDKTYGGKWSSIS